MSSRLACWLHGHQWGEWHGGWENIFGVPFQVRFCGQCGARDRRAG
jgi:hypothetical protein